MTAYQEALCHYYYLYGFGGRRIPALVGITTNEYRKLGFPTRPAIQQVLIVDGQILCSRCLRVKPLSDFIKDPKLSCGHRGVCLDCLRPQRLSSNRKQAYGVTKEEYDALMVKQGGKCAICRKDHGTIIRGRQTPLGVDHCHKTGKVRGLLCQGCNVGLGNFQDDPELLKIALAYLLTD